MRCKIDTLAEKLPMSNKPGYRVLLPFVMLLQMPEKG
jgi:hypothetical protein